MIHFDIAKLEIELQELEKQTMQEGFWTNQKKQNSVLSKIKSIITKSTFNNKPGSVINNKIEDTSVKSIVKNDDIVFVNAKSKKYSLNLFNKIYQSNVKADEAILKAQEVIEIGNHIKTSVNKIEEVEQELGNLSI